jgi:hypothetical protein
MKKLILLTTILASSFAFAYRGPAAASSGGGSSGKAWGFYFEPYAGYEFGNYAAKDPPAFGTTTYSGYSTATIVGGKLGLNYHNWFLGADASTLIGGKQSYSDSTQARDLITRDLLAANLGYRFGRAKIWAITFISNKYEERNDVAGASFNDYSGSGGIGLGLGYQFANHMAFNLEYHSYNMDTVDATNGGYKGPMSGQYINFSQKVYIMSLSFPFSK